MVSVDYKKKELVGQYRNVGRQWRPAGDPEKVDVQVFIGEAGKVIPYGVYDVGANTGWVNVGTDHETAAFAFNTLRSWWNCSGAARYPQATRPMITADSGGTNGNLRRTWKTELAALAAETGLDISVCHLPPGASKWNTIKHRLFAQITRNWGGQPLASHKTILNLIGATTTATGPSVDAHLDDGAYPIGVTVSDQQMKELPSPATTSTANGATPRIRHTRKTELIQYATYHCRHRHLRVLNGSTRTAAGSGDLSRSV